MFYVLPDLGIFLTPFFAGVVGLGVHFSTYTSEVFRAGIENVPKAQWEAAKSLNYNKIQTWQKVILPQAIPPMVPPLANYLITMFKETPLLAAITVVELFRAADQYSNSHYKYLEPMTLVGVFFLLVSIPSAIAAMKLENKFKLKNLLISNKFKFNLIKARLVNQFFVFVEAKYFFVNLFQINFK